MRTFVVTCIFLGATTLSGYSFAQMFSTDDVDTKIFRKDTLEKLRELDRIDGYLDKIAKICRRENMLLQRNRHYVFDEEKVRHELAAVFKKEKDAEVLSVASNVIYTKLRITDNLIRAIYTMAWWATLDKFMEIPGENTVSVLEQLRIQLRADGESAAHISGAIRTKQEIEKMPIEEEQRPPRQ